MYLLFIIDGRTGDEICREKYETLIGAEVALQHIMYDLQCAGGKLIKMKDHIELYYVGEGLLRLYTILDNSVLKPPENMDLSRLKPDRMYI